MLRIALHVVLLGSLLGSGPAVVVRQELFAPSTNGIRIHIREVRANRRGACDPILLVHGARVPGAASFDLPVAGGSLAVDLVEKGFCSVNRPIVTSPKISSEALEKKSRLAG